MNFEDRLNAPEVKDSGLPPKPPVMHLCILANTIATEVSQITLKDGHIPSIRGHQHHGRNGLTDFLLEPAVWFKVLVVDVVVVNCVQRQLSWEISRLDDDDGASGSGGQLEDFCLLKVDDSRNGVRGSIRRPKATKDTDSMSAEDSFDLDEVFDCLPGLVVDYERNVITASQFHDSLMKFLHLYILPSIVLTSRHTVSMKEGLRQQELFLQKVNEDIEGTSLKLEAVTQSKTKLRRKTFISNINGSSHGNLPFTMSLIITLLNDISDEILDISKDLEVAQDDVDRTKRMQKDSTTDDLAAARKTRDQIVQNYEELLRARENIVAAKNATETTHRRRSKAVRKSDRPEHRIYEELTSIQGELIAVMQSLAEKKLLILSVKEAMKLTLAELESGADSCGVDVETTGCLKATDVLDNGSTMRSLWMTLTEQVDEIIANPNHSLTKQHRKFCSSVAERCKAAIGERMIYETMRQLSDDSSGTQTTSSDVQDNDRSSSCTTLSNSTFYDTLSDCCKVVVPDEERNGTKHTPSSPQGRGKGGGGGGIFRKSRHRSGPASTDDTEMRAKTDSKTLYMLASSADDAVIVFEEDKNYARKAINTLQRDINKHFEDVTEQLRVELRQRSTTSLWLSYESHFYDATIDHILTLYALEYGAVTRTLGQTIRSLRATDLSFDDSILVKMLQEANNSVEDRTAVPDSSLDASSDVQLSPKTKAEAGRSESISQSDSDTPFKRLSSAANPEVDVEDFLPRLRLVSESEATVTDPNISSHPSRSKLRKLSNCESSPRTVRKSIRIAHPFSTVIVYDRTICSDPNSATSETINVNGTSNSSKGTVSSAIRKLKQEPARTMQMSPEYRRQFHQAFDLISVAVETRCLTTKFQQLTKCLRETSRQISIFCETVRGTTGVATCCDELMDGVLLLLCNLDESVLSQLHVQIMMMSDLMPTFFQCNSFNFTLVQFVGAFQFLKDNILMRQQQHTSNVVLRRS